MVGPLSGEELELLDTENTRRMMALNLKGIGVSGVEQKYLVSLIEAMCGQGVVRRVREETAIWLAERIDDIEGQVLELEVEQEKAERMARLGIVHD